MLTLLSGNGDGTFTLDQQLRFRATAYPFMAFADYNGDGHYDLIRNGGDPETLYVHLTRASASWALASDACKPVT